MNIQYINFEKFLSLQNNKQLVSNLYTNQDNFNKLLRQYENLQGKYHIFVTGMSNSGKSSLCNILVGDSSDSTFQTGDKRITTEIQKYTDTATGITYIDTPGIDVNKKDEDVKKILSIANLIIFVCSMASGSIGDNKEQIDYLEYITNLLPDTSKRISIVCSKFLITEKYEDTYNKTKYQLYNIFREELPTFLIDNQLFLDGVKYNDFNFMYKSGIRDLKKWIANNISTKSYLYNILENSKNQYINSLYEAQKEIKKYIEHKNNTKEELKNNIISSWYLFKEKLKHAYDSCRLYI